MVDVFVYVVVLNLFVEYFPQVFSETFTLSLLTAVLLKGALEVVVAAKNRVKARFRAASKPLGKVVAGFMLWLVLFGSKFVVLEVIHLIFRDSVRLGGFFSVTLLILVLMLARAGVRWLLQASSLPTPGPEARRGGRGGTRQARTRDRGAPPPARVDGAVVATGRRTVSGRPRVGHRRRGSVWRRAGRR